MANDTNADVRRTCVQFAPACSTTMPYLLLRTRYPSDAVRAEVYHALALEDRIPLTSLSIAHRAAAVRSGLREREGPAQKAARAMLQAWFRGSHAGDGDLVRLLTFLDVELHEMDARALVQTLINDHVVDPVAMAHAAQTSAQGLRTDPEDLAAEPRLSPLLRPEEALVWSVVTTHLAGESAALSSAAARGLGHATQMDAEASTRNLDALEAALPASVADYVSLVEQHWRAGGAYQFATRQLISLGATCVDFTDAAGRHAASGLVDKLLLTAPAATAEEVDDDAEAPLGCGGDGAWETAVADLAVKVHGGGVDLARIMCRMVHVARAGEETNLEMVNREPEQTPRNPYTAWVTGPASDAQLLGQLSLLARRLTSGRGLGTVSAHGVTMQDVVEKVVLRHVTSLQEVVRIQALAALGALLLVDGVPGCAKEHSVILRLALANHPLPGSPRVRNEAARALVDLCLVRSPALVDAATRVGLCEGTSTEHETETDGPSRSRVLLDDTAA